MRNHVTKNPGVPAALLVVLGFAVSSRTPLAAAPAADQAMLAADRAFTQAVARGDVKAVASFLDRGAAWTTVDGTTLNASQVGQGTPKAAISDEARSEAKHYGYDQVGVIQVNAGKLHGLRVWVKRPAGWRLLVFQDVRSLDAPPAATPGAGKTGKNCENPCGAVPYTPRSENERAVIAAYVGLEEAAMTGNAAAWSGYIAEEFALVSSNGDRVFDKPTRVAAIQRSTLGGVSPTKLLSARLFDFGTAVVMTSQHQPDRGDLLRITRVWVKRDGRWVETLSYQTAIRPSAATLR
jgi:hypothetical protein